jgi:general stress protein YciG
MSGKCLHCRDQSVRPRTAEGRVIAYRVFADLAIPDDVPILACGQCGARYFNQETQAALEPVLSRLYALRLGRIATDAIRRLKASISQRRLELLLGLSQGYLSRLAAGDGTPSSALGALLALLAEEQHHLETIRRHWARRDGEGCQQMTDEKSQEESKTPTVIDDPAKSPGTSIPTENRLKLKGGFSRLSPEEHRRVASLGGQAAQQTRLAHRFTPEEARRAGHIGGAKISSDREHMREIGSKGGRAKRGYKLRQQQAQMAAEAERAADDQAPAPISPLAE